MSKSLVLITGITGHVGFRVLVTALQAGYTVRGAIRREEQISTIKSQPSIKPFLASLSFAIIPDITVDGAFDTALKDVTYVLHVASPLPSAGGEDPEDGIVRPAIHGTVSILNSAAKVPSIRRMIITSSAVAVVPGSTLVNGDTTTVYTSNSRVRPLPSGPYLSGVQAYLASKVLALDAAERFIADRKPHFSIVHIMPSYVFGVNELVTDAKAVASGSNTILMDLLLGVNASSGNPGTVVHIDDVAHIHVGALDEKKILGNANFLATVNVTFEDALEIAAKLFPDAVKNRKLPLGGTQPTLLVTTDTKETTDVFGPFKGYQEMVESVAGHYLQLLT